jgi:hypothetical protein
MEGSRKCQWVMLGDENAFPSARPSVMEVGVTLVRRWPGFEGFFVSVVIISTPQTSNSFSLLYI